MLREISTIEQPEAAKFKDSIGNLVTVVDTSCQIIEESKTGEELDYHTKTIIRNLDQIAAILEENLTGVALQNELSSGFQNMKKTADDLKKEAELNKLNNFSARELLKAYRQCEELIANYSL